MKNVVDMIANTSNKKSDYVPKCDKADDPQIWATG